MPPFLATAIATGLGSLIGGRKPKDALRNALLAGIGGAAIGNVFGGAEAADAREPLAGTKMLADSMREPPETTSAAREITGGLGGKTERDAVDAVFKRDPRTLGIAEMIYNLNPRGFQDSTILRALNTPMGEALLFGLGSSVLDKFSKEDENTRARPFGGTEKFMPIMGGYAAGGNVAPMYFPRRNGGIMPSEGSGKEDDVPAMLMAGEFVLTKDAVKGLGDGNSERGIARAYRMMDRLERMA